eukprot:gb/GECH01009435.1/.p1 GENE.gb/GECH01009435.1/~~gb/GECH01009435.1/.p1  ORF type:complete len:520 (+),score=155.68 gb/GECH01009435.1/:1-1560(+)
METQVTPEKLKQLETTTGDNVWELSKQGKLLLVFLRMFACPYCRKAINDVNEISKSLKQLRVQVVFVHQGPEEMAVDVFKKFGSDLIRYSEITPHEETNEDRSLSSGIRDKLPFYEIVDSECEYYRMFGLSKINKLNFVRREWSTVNKAQERWGWDSQRMNIFQLGAFFVLDQGGEVFSSLRPRGQTNIHDLAELINVRQHVRFFPDHTKEVIYYPLNENENLNSKEQDQEKNNEQEKNRLEMENSVQIQEKYQEYRDFVHYAISDQSVYHHHHRLTRENRSTDQTSEHTDAITVEENENDSEKRRESQSQSETDRNSSEPLNRLPIPIFSKSSKFSSLLKCSPQRNRKERSYTEEEIKQVLGQWRLETVIQDDELLPFFKTFCTKELSVENVLFYETIKKFSRNIQKWIDQNDIQKHRNQVCSFIESIINEYLLFSSDNMVNVDRSHYQSFSSLLEEFQYYINDKESHDETIFDSVEKLQKSCKKAEDAVVLNMSDPFSRFLWSIEGERAAIYSIVKE